MLDTFGLRFSGEVWALPEGTVCFRRRALDPGEVTAGARSSRPSLVETRLIQLINLHSTLASKAARCAQAADGRTCVDFSLRRTQGREAGWAAARSSAIAGFTGTSNVEASQALGTMPVGTMAHAFVEAFGDELASFRAFAETFPEGTVLLVDTYDSVEGLHQAVQVAGELREQGKHLIGVRLDSGDLVGMSRQARQMLDAAGLEDTRVVVSGSLDEFRMAELVSQGAMVDVFGVGTKMGSSADAPLPGSGLQAGHLRRPPHPEAQHRQGDLGLPQAALAHPGPRRPHCRATSWACAAKTLEGEPLLKQVMTGGRPVEAGSRLAGGPGTLPMSKRPPCPRRACVCSTPRPLGITPR